MNSFFSQRTAEPLIYELFEEIVNLPFLRSTAYQYFGFRILNH